ncbi:MAG: hypothetical protein ACI97A_000392 [Planctomycetota bacterium]|jgi:hypothetical protein
MKHLTILALALTLALSANLSAQVVYVLDSGLPGGAGEVYLPSPAYPTGGTGPFGGIPLQLSGLLAPTPFGGMTIDQTTGSVYATDGAVITVDANPLYLPFGALPPFFPPAPAPPLLFGTPINGIAIDSIAGILWMTDGFSIGGFAPGPPYLPVAPVVPLAFFLPGPLTGLSWDTSTGTLWGCEAGGGIYNFTVAGVGVGPQPVAVVPIPGPFPLSGLAVNGTNGAGSIGAPFCSFQLPGYHICVTDGPAIYDALAPAAPILANPIFSGAPVRGLAFSNDFQILKGGVGCPSTGTFPFGGWAKATHTGPAGANAISMVGGPPATLTLLLYDTCPILGGLFVPASGETLWVNPLSPTFAFAPLFTDAVGSISAPVSFAPAVSGITLCMQFAVFDPLAPLGYCLSDAFQFTSGLQ